MVTTQQWCRAMTLLAVLVGALVTSPMYSSATEIVVPGILRYAPFDSCKILDGGTYYLENYGEFAIGDTVVALATNMASD